MKQRYFPKKTNTPVSDDSVSLNKYISDSGFCSRREADTYIEQGRVTINNEDATKGNRVYPGDVVEIDGEPIRKKVKTIYIAFNKPAGVTSTTDTKDKTNIVDYLKFPQRIFPIGRLDKDSEGIIFLTNDGDVVNKILRAGNNHEKEYIVVVDKPVTPEFIKQMSSGVKIMGQWTKPCKITQEGKSVFRIILTQGLNRQIRRMCETLDYKVVRLNRIRIMNVHLGKLPVGHWRYLTPEEMDTIQKMVSDSSKTEEASRIERKKPEVKKPAPKPEPAKSKEAPKGKGKDVPKEKKAAPKEQNDNDASEKPHKSKKLSYKEFRQKKK
ncbi:23S rRNA pseudouridine(2604) synthase RluF [Taibaiella soli]|uniref:Pseudouridine synthase n=1 Tax=Taibaiella soli TaxID=1649169 RepID=A0A2W2B1E4_9BACT|nr:23S rRNA pseudouridine(2604) synthase RluF [Taibaiella soli]PZF73818.1 23S rRNA pseudouridine(2604) synthase RluF [Taibaiella soli]